MAGGLQPGDVFLEMGGVKVDSARVMADQIHDADGRAMTILVQRGDEVVALTVTPLAPEVAQELDALALGVTVETDHRPWIFAPFTRGSSCGSG